MKNETIKLFETPQMQETHREAVSNKKQEPAFEALTDAMAEIDINSEMIDSCQKSNEWLRNYIKTVLNPILEESRRGITWSSLMEIDNEKAEGTLRKIAKVLGIVVICVGLGLIVSFYSPKAVAETKSVYDGTKPVEAYEKELEAVGMATTSLAWSQTSFPAERTSTQNKDMEALTSYLNAKAPNLTKCVEGIIQHDRWVEAVAITRIETEFCVTGHGPSPKNNCGNISSSRVCSDEDWITNYENCKETGRPNGRFKSYSSQCDSIEDIAILLETKRYKDKTIGEMNGVYCVDETTSKGGKCPDWTEVTMMEVNEIRDLLTK